MNSEQIILPELRFNEFTSYPPEIKFKEVVKSNIYGPRFNANDYDISGNVKTIRGTDISTDGELKYEQVPTAKLDDRVISHHKLEDGDLVMITTADCGLTGVFREQGLPYISSAYAVRIRLNEKGFPEYFKFFFQTETAKKEVARFIRKATVANLPGSDILKIRLHLPQKQEQQKIATFLSSVDNKIDQLQKKKEFLEQYKKGMMQKIFKQEIRFKDDNGKDFPKWKQTFLGNILKIGSGKDYKHLNEGNIPVYGTGGYMTSVDEYLYNGESVGIGRKGTIDKPIYLNGKFWTVDTLFYTHSFNKVIPKFIYIVFQQINWQKYNEASGVPSLSKKTLQKIKVEIPCIEEQTKIANFLSSIDDKIDFVTTEIEKVNQFKKGLLQQMFL